MLRTGTAVRCERLAKFAAHRCGLGGVMRDDTYRASFAVSLAEESRARLSFCWLRDSIFEALCVFDDVGMPLLSPHTIRVGAWCHLRVVLRTFRSLVP